MKLIASSLAVFWMCFCLTLCFACELQWVVSSHGNKPEYAVNALANNSASSNKDDYLLIARKVHSINDISAGYVKKGSAGAFLCK